MLLETKSLTNVRRETQQPCCTNTKKSGPHTDFDGSIAENNNNTLAKRSKPREHFNTLAKRPKSNIAPPEIDTFKKRHTSNVHQAPRRAKNASVPITVTNTAQEVQNSSNEALQEKFHIGR